jgi:hypothetical protein
VNEPADDVPAHRYNAALANEIERAWQDRWDAEHVFWTPNRTGLLSEDPRHLADRPNLFVKIPGTEPGLGAIEDSIAAGRSINVTLLFSLERHKEVMEAYVHGIERLIESGGDPSRVASVDAASAASRDRRQLSHRPQRGGSGSPRYSRIDWLRQPGALT